MARRVKSVTKQRKKTSHGFHLLATVFTGGLWAPVWAGMTAGHKLGPRQRVVTRTTIPTAAPVNEAPPPTPEEQYRHWYYNLYLPWAEAQRRAGRSTELPYHF